MYRRFNKSSLEDYDNRYVFIFWIRQTFSAEIAPKRCLDNPNNVIFERSFSSGFEKKWQLPPYLKLCEQGKQIEKIKLHIK